MSIHGRLTKLERGTEGDGGRCPECGRGPKDVRLVMVCGPNGEGPPVPEPAPEELCPACGEVRGIRLIDWPRSEGEEAPHGP